MAEPAAPVRRSPISHRTAVNGEDGLVRIAEEPFLCKFILRADPREADERLRAAFGLGLPFNPLTSSAGDGTAFLWLGPDEWMLITAVGETGVFATRAGEALAGLHCQIVDVGDYYTAIDVTGPRTRELLMKLTTLDLHSRSFRQGMVAGSVFGRANAIIWQTADDMEENGPAFRLFIRWSMADYLWCALADAGREWGVPEQVAVKGEKLTIS